MTRLEHLLTIAAEECNKIGQRISKAIRFTLEEVQPGQALTNAERIMYEFKDLQAVMELLEDEGALPSIWVRDEDAIERKKRKVELFLCHSFDVGTMGEEGIKPLPKCPPSCDGCKRVRTCINAGVDLPTEARKVYR